MPQGKAPQATAKKVALSQLSIWQGSIAEANSKAIDLSTFKAKAEIRSAFTRVDEANAALDDLELGYAVKMRRYLYRTIKQIPQVSLGTHPDSLSCQCWCQVR